MTTVVVQAPLRLKPVENVRVLHDVHTHGFCSRRSTCNAVQAFAINHILPVELHCRVFSRQLDEPVSYYRALTALRMTHYPPYFVHLDTTVAKFPRALQLQWYSTSSGTFFLHGEVLRQQVRTDTPNMRVETISMGECIITPGSPRHLFNELIRFFQSLDIPLHGECAHLAVNDFVWLHPHFRKAIEKMPKYYTSDSGLNLYSLKMEVRSYTDMIESGVATTVIPNVSPPTPPPQVSSCDAGEKVLWSDDDGEDFVLARLKRRPLPPKPEKFDTKELLETFKERSEELHERVLDCKEDPESLLDLEAEEGEETEPEEDEFITIED